MFFQHLEIAVLLLLGWVSMRNLLSFYLFSPYRTVVFFSGCFQDLFLVLSFQMLIVMSWHRFLWLGFARLLESVVLCLLLNWWCLQIYLWIFFSLSLSPLLLGLWWHKLLIFVIVPQVPETLYCYYYFFRMSLWAQFGRFCSMSQPTVSLLCPLHSVELIHWVLLKLNFLVLKSPVKIYSISSLRFPASLLRLSVFHLRQSYLWLFLEAFLSRLLRAPAR